MKLRIRNENQLTYLEIPDDTDFTLMIDADYERRLAESEDKDSVVRRTPQEIMDDLNRKEYNSWHKFDRHRGEPKKQYRKDDEDADETDGMDNFADNSDEDKRNLRYEYEDWCDRIRNALKPTYAEMIIAIHLDGLSVQEYAACIGDKPNNVSHRLKRAEKIFREIFPKTSFSSSSQGYQVGGQTSESQKWR